jgi:hypothetical protein
VGLATVIYLWEDVDMDLVEWEWREEDPTEYATLNASSVWAAYADGKKVRVLVLADRNGSQPEDDASMWTDFIVTTADREGFSGFEPLNSYGTLNEAKTTVENDKEALIDMIREID